MTQQMSTHTQAALVKQPALYVHIPFCGSLCHYCDFAKTSLFSEKLIHQYIGALESHLEEWLATLKGTQSFHPGFQGFSSVFFGGGTPSLLSHEYEPFFEKLNPYVNSETEITLEANPDDLLDKKLTVWKSFGVNRLSIGVQTFEKSGLAFLKRRHGPLDALLGVKNASLYFQNINIDLIYGWPHQTFKMWQEDLKKALDLPLTHLSLYHLTYEPKTPIGRAYHRGAFKGMSDEFLADYYEWAREFLGQNGFRQYEVSNWSREGYQCKQNINYWSGQSYLGIGSGAAGYLSHSGPYGFRYQYPRNERFFIKIKGSVQKIATEKDIVQVFTVEWDKDRDASSWLLEQLASSLRYQGGINISAIEKKLGKSFNMTHTLSLGVTEKKLIWQEDSGERFLKLDPSQWFLEMSWAQAIIPAFESSYHSSDH